MNRAENSDSITHAEKSNPTSRTDFSSKTLWDIFLGHPVGAIPLFSPPLSFHNFSILVLADHHHHLPISKATQTSAADLAVNSFQLVEQ